MIPYGRQSISEEDIEAVSVALRGDLLTTGPLVEHFESALEAIVGAPTVSVSSGTAALHCAYAAIELQPGDEVITPPMTFIATQATAAMFGAKIVFADIQSDTGNIDPAAVEAVITSRTKAIVAVDYAGHPAELSELRAIADKNRIFLIEDAAHSIGSRYRGRPVGSIADLTTFSFFPTKNMTTAEGGAVASIHPDLLLKARRFSRQGLIRNQKEFKILNQGIWHQEVHKFGLNYRLPDVLAALGVSQLKRIQEFKKYRERIFDQYSEVLRFNSDIKIPIFRDYTDPMWHLYAIHVPSKAREKIFNGLRRAGIGAQVNYIPAYWHPVFQDLGYKKGAYPVSDAFYQSEISIPMHTGVTSEDVLQISQILESLTGEI